jgi:hypothetical protein
MKTGKRLFQASVILVLVLVWLPHTTLPAFGQPANPLASLEPLQGLVQYRPADAAENDWRTLAEIQLVGEGDWIRTDSLGLATLTFFEGVEADILPNSMLQVSQLKGDEQNPAVFQVTLGVTVGDTRSQLDQVLDPQSRYEIDTPSAIITVRGTNFWTSANWLSQVLINTLQGVVAVTGILPDGRPGDTRLISQDQSVTVFSEGNFGFIGPLTDVPHYPPQAPLAPQTCGDAICEPGEETVCPLDCRTFPDCGDKICQLDQGEGPVTCPADCVPSFRGAQLQAANEPCTIQTPQFFVAQRVGPGFNRSIRRFLPANQPFPVIGQAQAADGSLWWQIQVEGIPEAWVLQSDVLATGACQVVPQATPPPIIVPIVPQVPQVPQAPVPTPLPGVTPVPPPAATAVPPMSVAFYADKYTISRRLKECATVYWAVEGIREVYYQGVGVTGHESRVECPQQTTTYTLTVVALDGQQSVYTVTITVN